MLGYGLQTALKRLFIFIVAASVLVFFYTSFSPIDGSRRGITTGFEEEFVDTKGIDVNVIGLNEENKRGVNLLSADARCKIPKLSIDNPEILKFDGPPKPLNCKKPSLWFDVDFDNKLVLTDYGKRRNFNMDQMDCQVLFFDRRNDNELKWEKPIKVKPGDTLDHSEYFNLRCDYHNKTFSHLFMNAYKRDDLVQQVKERKQPSDWSGLNLFFMGLDSLSQQAYRRSLPLTVKFLEEELGSVVLDGYNIVGDGTPQAFIPILTAQTEEELPLTRKRFPEAKFVDEAYPFIWKNFSDAGYMTVYGEDAAAIGTFTYRLKGFRNQPADIYTRTWFQHAESFEPNIRCNGPIPQHKTWFKFANDIMRKYPKDLPKFLLMFHSLLSHDDINLVKLADKDFRDLLKSLKDDGFFDDTVVVIMADHGNRFAGVRATQQGQLEERLPFMSFSLPEKFKQTEIGRLMYENLKKNKGRLSTPFDIHATLMNILHLPTKQELMTVQDASKRSLSLFKQLPEDRTCDQAGIAAHWCTCLSWQDSANDPQSSFLAKLLVQSINKYTSAERKLCAPLKLAELLSVKKLIPNNDLLKYNGVKDLDGFVPELGGNVNATLITYQLKLRTTPGDAVYEATMQHDEAADRITLDFRSISHINKYGDRPHCIIDKNYFLATYCVCYDKI